MPCGTQFLSYTFSIRISVRFIKLNSVRFPVLSLSIFSSSLFYLFLTFACFPFSFQQFPFYVNSCHAKRRLLMLLLLCIHLLFLFSLVTQTHKLSSASNQFSDFIFLFVLSVPSSGSVSMLFSSLQ